MANYHVQTLANSIIGTAILAMPYCFSKCGVILSILLLIISTIITRSCCHYLIKASIVTRRRNMELLGFHMFGSAGKTMVEISVIGFLMGTCIAFYVVIGDLSPLIVAKIFNVQSYSPDSVRRFLIILITITCVIPLCFQKSIESLSFVCRASIGFYICLTLKTVYESFERFESDSNWASNIDLWKPSGVLQCIPIFSMAMSCQMQLFEVYEIMGFPSSFDRIKRTVHQATLICCVAYCIVGFFGYLAFYNQKLSGNVLMNFRPSLANDAITIGFILSIACSFPLVIFPCRTALASFLHRKGHHSEIASHVPESKYKPLTLFIIFTTMVLGILIPSVEVIISLVGSTIGVLVCILFPATCFIKIMQRNTAEKTFAQVLIVLGFVIMILGTYANLTAIDTAKSGSHLQEKPSIIDTLVEHPKDTHNSMKAPDLLKDLPKVDKLIDDNTKKKQLDLPQVKKKKVKGPDAEKSVKKVNVTVKEPEIGVTKVILDLVKMVSVDTFKKLDQEVAASKDPKVELKEKNEEIKVLKDSKDKLEKEVHEMKEELVKQNKETQQLVLQKFGEIAEKVDKIEKISLESAPSAKEKVPEAELDSKIKPKPDTNNVAHYPIDNDLIPLNETQLSMTQVKFVKPQELRPVEVLQKAANISKPTESVKIVPVAPTQLKPIVKPLTNETKPVEIKPVIQLDKPDKIETRVDPIVQLLKSQEPLSYQVGEKMMESKKTNVSVKAPEKLLDTPKLIVDDEIKNEMRKKRDAFEESLNSLDKTLQNFEFKTMIGRDLKATSDDP